MTREQTMAVWWKKNPLKYSVQIYGTTLRKAHTVKCVSIIVTSFAFVKHSLFVILAVHATLYILQRNHNSVTPSDLCGDLLIVCDPLS